MSSASIVGPSGKITLYEDIPFSNNYSHSIYFEKQSYKKAYFDAHKIDGGELDNQNYVKTENGKIRVQRDANKIQNACYMSWENPNINKAVSGGTEVHQADICYAFITDITFISPVVSEITYEIDVIQTYVICPGTIDTDRIELQNCLIERRHYASCKTNPTVNLEPESIPITKKLVSNASKSNTDNKLLGEGFNTLLVFTKDYIDYNEQYATDSDSIAAWFGMKAGGLLQGLFIEVVKASDRQRFLEYVLTKPNKAEAIVSIVAVPDTLVDATSNDILLLANNNRYEHDTGSVNLSNWNEGMDGIISEKIINKKLFTSPYNTLLMTDGTQTKELEFEYIGTYQANMDATVELEYTTVLSCQPNAQIQFLIKNYGRSGVTPNYNLQASFLLSDLQKVPWSSDSFANWLGNNGVQTGVNTLTNMLSGAGGGFAVGGIPGAVGGAVLGLGTGIVNSIGSAGQAAVKPPILQGSCSANPLMAVGEYDVHLYRSCLSHEDVERIDDYFTMFGYACNRIGNPIDSMVPAINALGFCYIKTAGCLALGKGPASYLRKVEDIFNKGITFWDQIRVGNYEYR